MCLKDLIKTKQSHISSADYAIFSEETHYCMYIVTCISTASTSTADAAVKCDFHCKICSVAVTSKTVTVWHYNSCYMCTTVTESKGISEATTLLVNH